MEKFDQEDEPGRSPLIGNKRRPALRWRGSVCSLVRARLNAKRTPSEPRRTRVLSPPYVEECRCLRGYANQAWPCEISKDGWPGRSAATPRGQALADPRGLEDSSPATQITHSSIRILFPDNLRFRAALVACNRGGAATRNVHSPLRRGQTQGSASASSETTRFGAISVLFGGPRHSFPAGHISSATWCRETLPRWARPARPDPRAGILTGRPRRNSRR